ncbi:MAG TPA: segregation/condensation protein A [Edaphocola sp.]|nr:segregation/condensation protein A [Edaphocola sp.]
MSEQYLIKIPQFEGPFDLLLFFIERDELDIYNIPIQNITQEFLAYIQKMEQLNIEMASEFILFVSTLMRIKAKMLLPRREIDASGNTIDPRQELVDKLLEYKRYKEAADQLAAMEAERLLHAKRGNVKAEMELIGNQLAEGSEIQTVSVYRLVNTFERVMKKFQERQNKPQHVVIKYNYSMESQRVFLVQFFEEKTRANFEELFGIFEERIQAIFTFLALLEMAQQNVLKLLVGEGRNNFIIEKVHGLENFITDSISEN